MANYTKSEARAWVRENLVGAINCTIPSFTSDLENINDKAIRHDIALAKEHGFIGSLAISEVNITRLEYADFMKIMKEEGGKDFVTCHHAAWSTLAQNIESVKAAEEAGVEFVLLSYPPNFYPETEDEIYDYTKAFCDATDLAVMVFPMFLWGFSPRIHPADISTKVLRRLIDDCPNIAAIKAEGGYPTIQSTIECQRLFGDEVVISMPMEADFIPLAQVMPFQLSATSDHEFWGPFIPRICNLLREEKYDEVTELYWKMHPARKAKSAAAQALNGGFFINRMLWKFQGWLQGYNGGPLRMPTSKIQDAQMNMLRNAQRSCGLNPTEDPLREFFIGRNPT